MSLKYSQFLKFLLLIHSYSNLRTPSHKTSAQVRCIKLLIFKLKAEFHHFDVEDFKAIVKIAENLNSFSLLLVFTIWLHSLKLLKVLNQAACL